MAAFIQKLFKSRKSSNAADTKRPAPQAPEVADVEDPRASLRKAQLEQLNRSPDQATLASLAIDGVTADIRLTAARQLTDEAQLQAVQKQAKGRDKGVYQAVKQALQAQREEQERQARVHQTIATLIQNADEQSRSDDTSLYEARLDALQSQWREVEAHASAEQVQQFLEAIHRCRARLDAMARERAEAQRHQEQKYQREATLELLTTTLAQLRETASDTPPSLASLDALLKTQENRWLEATRDTDVGKQEQKTYETHMLALRNYLAALRRLSQAQDSVQALTETPDHDPATDGDVQARAKALLEEISWPEDFSAPSELGRLRKLAGKKPAPASQSADQQAQDDLARQLSASLEKLERALDAKQFRESKQLLKTAQNQFRALDQKHSKRFQARMQLLTGQFRELSDWQGFVTEPKQISLCEQMEYLAQQPMDPEAKAERIKELQAEWRALGGSSDRTLWTRFKEASDRAFEPCKAYFEAKSGLKQVNLEKRKAICAELSSFLDKADWNNIDWKGAERIHQTARQEWKAAWPVEFRDNRPLQKQFDALLGELESKLDAERQRNEALKREIVDKAQALIRHEPLSDAMHQAKALQAEWKAVGITRRREDRKLWQAFRKACDQIFARRDEQRTAQQRATEAADQAAAEQLQAVAELNSEPSTEALTHALERLGAIDPGKLSASMKERVLAERTRLEQALKRQRVRATLDTWKQRILEGTPDASALPSGWTDLATGADETDGLGLVIRAEILAGVDSPEADQKRRMEIQVQRLAEGINGTERQRDSLTELERVVAQWCLAVPDSEKAPALSERLIRAIDAMA